MAGIAPSRRTATQRLHFIVVRSATLFVIAAAAIASCQSSKDDAVSPVVGFIEQETCLDWGGRWVSGRGMCDLGSVAGEQIPGSSPPVTDAAP